VWFAMHSLFGQVHEIKSFGLSLGVPVWNSINLPALAITLSAMVAIFRFKVGMLAVLSASCLAGIVFHFFSITGS